MSTPRSKAPAKGQDAKARTKAVAMKAPARAPRPSKKPARSAAGSVYQVKITLEDVRPEVWRRVLVKDCSLADLHDIIQDTMGWQDYHLHLFAVRGEHFGDPLQWPDDP